jgi:lipopolysaccharide/colanic/teichoic acid biosynthesis glycosyltransferase
MLFRVFGQLIAMRAHFHRCTLLAVDVVLVGFATVVALFLRYNFEASLLHFGQFVPYLLTSLLTATIVLTIVGLNRTIWRFSSLFDYINIVAAVFFIVLIAVAVTFLVQRLDGVPRSVPVLQWLLVSFALIGIRVAARLLDDRRRSRAVSAPISISQSTETVLVVGITVATDLYLRTVAEFGGQRVRIAGILSSKTGQTGRLLHQHSVLGSPAEVEDVLRQLEVHGICVDRIVVTVPLSALAPDAQKALRDIETKSDIKLDYLFEQLGLGADAPLRANENYPADGDASDALNMRVLEAQSKRRYFKAKRFVDRILAAILMTLCFPVYAVVGVAVAIDVGWPLLFWQQRPGRGGRPFRVYKFRTMRAAHDASGRRLSDISRLSFVGRFLRKTRLDELPQLYNIVMGDMSFIGPRPLLPVDQTPEFSARLLVPPGLTGWAQVAGGSRVSARDKAALDIWYVYNASLVTDLRIVWRTIPMITFGERLDKGAIDEAWRHLEGRSRAP